MPSSELKLREEDCYNQYRFISGVDLIWQSKFLALRRLLFTLMMNSVEFETRKCTRDGGPHHLRHRPGTTGGHSRAAFPQITVCAPPTNENCALPSENWAPKKLTGSVLLECKSRPKTLKILVITLNFVSKNCFFVDFAIYTNCFCGLTPEFMIIRVYFGSKIFFFSVFT